MPESPAAELRQAASLIRERTALVPPSPWYSAVHDVTTYDGLDVIASSGLTVRAQYIASWHPGVALAVADWLDAEAERAEQSVRPQLHSLSPGALAVARAYLKEAADA
jgi:hypothetical protein